MYVISTVDVYLHIFYIYRYVCAITQIFMFRRSRPPKAMCQIPTAPCVAVWNLRGGEAAEKCHREQMGEENTKTRWPGGKH